MVIIPEEAEAVLPILQTMESPKTHLITYAPPITRQMMHFSEMQFYTVPTLKQPVPTQVIIEIGLLAGRLYFEYDDYADIMAYMGMRVPSSGVSDTVKAHFLASSKKLGWQGRAFCKDVTGFLGEWLAATRTGQDSGQTPMGYVSQGRPLRSDHPFFARVMNEGDSESGSESLSEIGSDQSGSSDEDSDSEFMDVDE